MKPFSNVLACSNEPKYAFNLSDPLIQRVNSCKSIDQLKQSHAQLLRKGLFVHPFPASRLLKLAALSSFASLHYAHLMFHQISSPDLFIWNTMIKAHAPTNSSHQSLQLFKAMLAKSDHSPNQYTFAFLFHACCHGALGIAEGEQVRTHAIKHGLHSNVFVNNSLIRAYATRGSVEEARRLFDESAVSDLVTWNSMMAGYVGTGDMDVARQLFDEMPQRDVVSWSTMMAGYVKVGCFMEAMNLFHQMQLVGIAPNEFTLVSALSACANLVALDQGRWIHAYVNKARIKVDGRLLAGIIDMYAKCGEIETALEVFKDNSQKATVWPWNAMISGLATHGRANEAISLFERMKIAGIAPNEVTFVALLNACSHGGLVKEARFYFETMTSFYGIEPSIEHYGCMADLLGRTGLLREAEEIITTMPMAPDPIIWGALLGACRIHGDMEMGERIGRVFRESESTHVGCHVLLANIYSGFGRWREAKDLREKIRTAGKKKTPGCSSIELDGTFHQFLVGDRSHPQTKQIYAFLDEMTTRLKYAGYMPDTGDVLLDIDEEDKETTLSRHSEKLAIAFGLINTMPRTTIRIVKNLRVCGDCHAATKYISKVYEREIVVRDRIRFHHFKDGSCSCKDFW